MIERVTRETLGQQVLRRLQQYILTHGLGPGDRLPTERELAASLGVSSHTVRGALKSLETIGALARKQGHGTVLQAIDFSLLADLARFQMLHSPDDLVELFVARRLLEVSVLPLVASSATEDDFRRMEETIRQMDAEIDVDGRGVEGDIAFHQALLAAANNKFLAQFGALLQEFFRQARMRVVVDGQESRRPLEDHRHILQALRDGDVERAQRLMGEHLDHYPRKGVIPSPPPTSGKSTNATADVTERKPS